MTIREMAYLGLPLDIPIIDAHTHIGPQYNKGWHQKPEHITVEGQLEVYDRLGIDCCVTAPHHMCSHMIEITNLVAADAAKRFPGRVYGYIYIAPYDGMEGCKRDIARYGQDPSFLGLKFLPGYNGGLDQAVYQYAADFANEMRCPILCHTWENNPPLKDVLDLAEKRPDLSLLVAHQGGGQAEMTRRCAERMRDLPNVWMELCGSLHNKLGVEDMVELVGEDRLIFGTDMTDLDPRFDFGRVAFSTLPDGVKRKIFAANYLSVLERSQMGKISDMSFRKEVRI